jgi:GAF domain-containing protein
MRIILTGFTDVEDLVEAINSGQVYKYITKPWDPNELKQVVQRAAETYELLKQRTDELHQAQAQIALLNAITEAGQQSGSLDDGADAIASAFKQTFAVTDCKLWLDASNSADSMVQAAASTARLQVTNLATGGTEAVPAQAAMPVPFQDTILAVLSLQWAQPQAVQDGEMALIQLAARQVGVVLAALR